MALRGPVLSKPRSAPVPSAAGVASERSRDAGHKDAGPGARGPGDFMRYGGKPKVSWVLMFFFRGI